MIKIENLTHIYNKGLPSEKVAIKNINLTINKGETIGIIGHTGSGKSTLVQHLNGLIKPTQGTVFIDDEDIYANKKKIKSIRFKVGLVFQYPEYQLFEENIFKDIAFGPKNMGLDSEEIKNRVIEAIKFCGINPDYLDKSPFELSGGQKRRVAIAGVLAMQPQVLVLDEPAAGLDPRGRKTILSQIKKYQREKNATVILVSHSMEDIATYADRVIVMDNGEVFCVDTMANVFKKHQDLVKIGLDIPQITSLMSMIKLNLPTINDNVYTVNDAKKEILRFLKRGQYD
ncbi:MAG: energy-coupling factor transporter ATPase [Oscillospiraceae bacterium]